MAALSFLLICLVVSHGAAFVVGNNENNWQSVNPNLEFVQDEAYSVRRNTRRSLSFYEDNFVDGLETAYNQYAQAWRLIGLYVDCNVYEEGRRRLEEVQEEEQDGSMCKRYLVWGAYVDLDYKGKGLSEYQIYNTEEKKWDKSACNSGDSDRCAKMDCHHRASNFKALGYFRQANPVEFLQVLAERQGSCTWDSTMSNTVTNSINWLPQGCTQTEIKVKNQNGNAAYVYFDLKPTSGAGIDIGIYTDAKCSIEYLGDETTTSAVITAYTGGNVNVEQTMEGLNQALEAFKVCTPCRTFDFEYSSNNQNNENDEEGDGDQADDNGDPNNQNFICNDAAGNQGTNMCMAFAQNTEIYPATDSDIFLASQQGTIQRTYSAADAVESWWDAWGFLLISSLVFVLGLVCFCSVAVKRKRVGQGDKSQPLIGR